MIDRSYNSQHLLTLKSNWHEKSLELEESPLDGLVIKYKLNKDKSKCFLSILRYPEKFDYFNIISSIRLSIISKFQDRSCQEFLSDKLPNIVKTRKKINSELVAVGIQPEHGQDGSIEYIIPPPTHKHLLKQDGTIDFHTKDTIKSVSAGDTVAIIYPPTEGKDGLDVFGNIIKAKKGREIKILPSLNTETVTQPDGKIIIKATSSGQIHYEIKPFELKIRITPTLVITSDVNFKTGNINFKGSVIVHGSVLSGFSVITSGNLTVMGLIEPNCKITVGGDLFVHKGILGNPSLGEKNSEIKVFGNLKALYIENARVNVEGDITVRSIMNSFVSSNGSIYVEKSIIGGNIICLKNLFASEIGNPTNIHTEITCGVSPSLRTRLDLYVKIIDDLKKQLEDVSKNLTFIKNKGFLLQSEKYQALYASLEAKQQRLIEQINKLEIRKADLAINLLQENNASISAKYIHKGVTIIIRTSKKITDKDLQNVTLYQKMPEEVIITKPFKGKL